MTTELAVRPQLTTDVWQMIQAVSPAMKDSRLFAVATEEQATAIMVKGHELGLGLAASFEFIHVIENRPTLSPRGALALILNSPYCEQVKIVEEADPCTVTMKRVGGYAFTAKWTMQDAKRAGVIKTGSGWDKYPANMLRWRAIGFCADVVFPDVIGGMKRSDEFGADLTPSGDVIEGSWQQVGSQPLEAAPQPAEPETTQPDPMERLNALVQQHGAEAIMAANDGKIPATNEELDSIEAKLSNPDD
jgi:hypothetical protein